MRLIDADKLVEIISQAEKKFPLDDRNPRAIGNRQCLFWIKNEVCQQPTAYDVDEVVRELGNIAYLFNTPTYDNPYVEGCVVNEEDAINIVKRGGVDNQKR